jgi:hypothetical protein
MYKFLVIIGLILYPTVSIAQTDQTSDQTSDLIRRLRGAPGGRIGGATRGIHNDNNTQQPQPQPTQPPQDNNKN